MAFFHGIRAQEISSALVGASQSTSALPVVVGSAPLTNETKSCIDQPILCYSFTDFTDTFGWNDNWNDYTLCEFAYVFFQIFNCRPAIFINVKNPSSSEKLDADDIINGLNQVENIYPKFALVPGLLLAPKWSSNPAVAASLIAHSSNINSLFNCIAIADIDSSTVKNHANANTWKNSNSFTSNRLISCWPMLKLDDKLFHLSSALAALICKLDSDSLDIPYLSPSNQTLQTSGLALADFSDVLLSFDQANLLNSQGISTALNLNGFRFWGNRLSDFPSNTDPLSFICVRRMLDWWANSFILSYFSRVDLPLNRRTVKSIIDSEQIRLNSFVARGILLDGSIKFLDDENPITDLISGKLTLHVYLTPPVPCEQIVSIVEFDAAAYQNLFK